MKKGFALFIVLMMLFMFVGCANSTASTEGGNGVKETSNMTSDQDNKDGLSGKTITIMASAGWVADVDYDLAERFEAETGIKIEYQIAPDDQYQSVLKSKLSTGEGPDVFMYGSGVALGTIVPEENAYVLDGQPWVDRLQPWAKEGSTYNGKLIGFNTWSVDGWGLLINQNAFDKAGIADHPSTYEEFTAACDALLDAGITPIFEPGAELWHQGLWLNFAGPAAKANDPELYDKLNNNEANFADIKMLELALTQLKEMVDKGYMGKNFIEQGWDGCVDAMASGEYGMMYTYTTFQNEVLALDPATNADEWSMIPVPLAGNDMFGTSAGGITKIINKNSENIEAALAYFNWQSQPENLKEHYAGKSNLGPISFVDVQGNESNAFVTVKKNSAGGTGLDFEGGTKYFDIGVIGGYVQGLYYGSLSPIEVLESVDAERQKIFDVND